jgi:raffinose/stachyose/melibiose transport system permease protein
MSVKSHKHISNSQKRRTFALFTVPGFVLYSTFFIFPILMGIYYSLTDWNGISRKFNFIGLENYLQIFKDKEFIQALAFTMKYSLLLVLFTVVIGVALALLLNCKVKGLALYRAVYFIPAVLSMLTVGLIFNQIFYRVIPYIGEVFGIDFLSKNLLSSQFTAMWAILFVNLWQGLAIPTLLFLSGLQSIPEDLYEAAALDGASNLQRFKAITFPFLIPVLSVVLVLTLKSGLMVFDYIKSLTEGGPGGTTQSIAILIYNHGFTQNKFAYSIAEAIITGIIISVISAVQISASNRKKV